MSFWLFATLYTRILLHDIVVGGASVPDRTRGVEHGGVEQNGDLGLVLEQLNGQALSGILRDVAVDEPSLGGKYS